MAVIPSSFGPKADRQAEIDAVRGVHRYRQTFRMMTDDKDDPADVVCAYPLLPQDGDALPSFPSARVVGRRARQPNADLFTWWEVDVEWSSQLQGESAVSPLDRPPKVRWRTETYQQHVRRANVYDLSGNLLESNLPMMSSARELFDPTDPDTSRDQSRLTASVSGNVAYVPAWVLGYLDATNSDYFTLDGLDLAPFQAKFSGLAIGEKLIENGVQYREVSFEVHCLADGFRREVMDAGFRELADDASGVPTLFNIYDAQGQPVSKPWPLWGAGHRLDPAWGIPETYYRWQVYEELPFSALGLPT